MDPVDVALRLAAAMGIALLLSFSSASADPTTQPMAGMDGMSMPATSTSPPSTTGAKGSMDFKGSMDSMASCNMVGGGPDPAFASGTVAGVDREADEWSAAGDRALAAARVSEAAQDWQAALQQYHAAHNAQAYCRTAGQLGAAYQSIGNDRLAFSTLVRGLSVADQTHDQHAAMILSGRLGSVLTFSRPPGDTPPDAQPYLQRSIALARQLNDPAGEAAALNDLGNYQSLNGQADQALSTFDAAANQTPSEDRALSTRIRINAVLCALHANNLPAARTLIAQAAVDISDLASPDASLLLSLGRSAQLIAEADPKDSGDAKLLANAVDWYRRGIDLAAKSGDDLSSSFAWGYLGNLYELHGGNDHLNDALSASRRARFFAQSLQRREALYQWEWQCGRILARQGERDEAIRSYQRAMESLQAVRDDVALGNAGSTFRTNVGPLFYELADLLLRRAGDLQQTNPPASQQSLEDARGTVETLKAAELKNYFQDECVRVASANQQDVDDALKTALHTAVLYVIPLEDRTELLLSLPPTLNANDAGSVGRPVLWRADPVPVGRVELYKAARQMRYDDENVANADYMQSGGKLYDWLIRPVLPQLTAHGIRTLVFVPDGDLRLISPAALYDVPKKRFLVESFAIAVTPGLTLASPEASKSRANTKLLAAGLSQEKTVQLPGESAETFDALPGVVTELQGMNRVYGQQQRTLSNANFDQQNVAKALDENAYSIVHLATHAQFNQDSRKTFVLANDGPMDLNRLEQLIEPCQFRGQPVELLSLSACETAAGDDGGRAALGLAGVAIRAGARSALATLWLADDTSTARLVPLFYRKLVSGNGVTKAEALQTAQVELLNDPDTFHPRFWAPFLIIGNWR